MFRILTMYCDSDVDFLPGCRGSIPLYENHYVFYTGEKMENFMTSEYHIDWKGFADTRNNIMKCVCNPGDIVLWLDADERLSQEWIDLDVDKLFEDQSIGGYLVEIDSPHIYKEGWKVVTSKTCRLFRYGAGQYIGDCHEQIGADIVANRYNLGTLQGFKIRHLGYDLAWNQLEEKIRRNELLLKGMPNNSVRNFHLGNVYSLLGDYDRSLYYYELAYIQGNLGAVEETCLKGLFACALYLKKENVINKYKGILMEKDIISEIKDMAINAGSLKSEDYLMECDGKYMIELVSTVIKDWLTRFIQEGIKRNGFTNLDSSFTIYKGYLDWIENDKNLQMVAEGLGSQMVKVILEKCFKL